MMDRRSFMGASIGAAATIGAFGTAPLLARGNSGTIDPIAYLDPELRPAARQLLAGGNLALSSDALPAMRAEGKASAQPTLPEIDVSKRTIPGAPGLPPVTVYVVNGGKAGSRPAILHTHGGGHILGSAEGELRYLQELARDLDCLLVTVEYRLAPETRYDGSIEDNYAALRWLHANAVELGADPSRIALLGESAGGTHAALLAITARDRDEVPVLFQALVYPMLDDRTGSTRQMPPWIGAILWDAAANRFGWEAFLGTKPGGTEIPVAGVPARIPDLSGLPPAWIGVGGADLFVEEDVEYASRLTEAGVPTELLVVPRAFHAFDRIVPDAAVSQRFTAAKMDALRRAFARGAD
ncbi:acetyl esterase/lipase [Altererythrobacter atlanticus]|uniref:Carboxylesterase NlhH n=1 Tax=Croceibacterium atlanticum TaxID=1267766 RepID=A0A0F7KQI7_9SPHN|nr:alpha/beta hydrolase [Croceibacterium atlanticum]AKH41407.1 Carboxylesterase NlhH [Croceibacterium atlanticum]MBB5732869.1 acetyl esterase/lipase [Croceibacterium atlanticum]